MKSPKDFEKIFIHRDVIDMRKGINGLCEIVQMSEMGDLMGKNLFIFSGRRKNAIKILYFDQSGFCLWQKKLDQQNFSWPKLSTSEIVDITAEQLSWLLEGYDVWKMKPFEKLYFERVS